MDRQIGESIFTATVSLYQACAIPFVSVLQVLTNWFLQRRNGGLGRQIGESICKAMVSLYQSCAILFVRILYVLTNRNIGFCNEAGLSGGMEAGPPNWGVDVQGNGVSIYQACATLR